MDKNITGRFIAELRKQKGFTQKELAEKLMVTDKAISRWETGKGLPDTSLLKPLGDVLGVSITELLSGKRIEEVDMKEQADNIILESSELFKAYACKCNKCNHFHYWHRFHNFTAIFGKSKLYLDTGSYHCCNSNSLHLHTKEEGFNESNE